MEELSPSEISQVIKQKIDSLDTAATPSNEGTIVYLADGIVRIHGLAEVMNGELIEFEEGVMGMALNLERDSVGAV
ncbi:MAG TPA: F0F1 ATP synthase subunit alpha, partial [Gammaproteobacteria bacterium]|nr:F0F1 ATP synthase subunit alpha [Gammaproteobacteria bacterium]